MAEYASENDLRIKLRAHIGYEVSQHDLAKQLGVSDSTLSRFLSGHPLPRGRQAVRMLRKLGYDPKLFYRRRGAA